MRLRDLFDAWGLPVATQRRAPDAAQDAPRRWPDPGVSGWSGTIASPSRLAALEDIPGSADAAPSPWPRTNGWWGTIATGFRGLIDFSTPPPFPWPGGRYTVHYHRQPHPNIVPVSDYASPIAGPVDQTINAPEEARFMAASPVPYDLHRVTLTFSKVFDTRLHADYLPPEQMQMGAPSHGAQGAGAQMLEPYFPRLTRWIQPGSFGQTTQVLSPEAA